MLRWCFIFLCSDLAYDVWRTLSDPVDGTFLHLHWSHIQWVFQQRPRCLPVLLACWASCEILQLDVCLARTNGIRLFLFGTVLYHSFLNVWENMPVFICQWWGFQDKPLTHTGSKRYWSIYWTLSIWNWSGKPVIINYYTQWVFFFFLSVCFNGIY